MLEKQNHIAAKRKTIAFRIPAGGKLGDDVANFFALSDEKVEGYGMPISELGLPYYLPVCYVLVCCFLFLLLLLLLFSFVLLHGCISRAQANVDFLCEAVLLLEAVGLFQLIGLGIGDWEALG